MVSLENQATKASPQKDRPIQIQLPSKSLIGGLETGGVDKDTLITNLGVAGTMGNVRRKKRKQDMCQCLFEGALVGC